MRWLIILLAASTAHAVAVADYFQRTSRGNYWIPSTAGQFVFNMGVVPSGSSTARDSIASVRGGQPGNDQCAEVVVGDANWGSRGGGNKAGVALRLQWDGVSATAPKSGYAIFLQADNGALYRFTIEVWEAGVATATSSSSQSANVPQLGDRLRACIVGNVITANLYQGSTGTTPRIPEFQYLDSGNVWTGGYPGLSKLNVSSAVWLDFWGWDSTSTQPLREWACYPNCYIATDGEDNGTGAIDGPLNMQWIVAKCAVFPVGTTVYMRGGTYTYDTNLWFKNSAYISLNCQGSALEHINFRAYPGETVHWDIPVTPFVGTPNYGLSILGQYTWVYDIDLNDPETTRIVCASHRPDGLFGGGTGNGFINGRIRNFRQGFVSNTATADGFTLRGSLIYNNGENNNNGGSGQTAYIEHDPPGAEVKLIEGNFWRGDLHNNANNVQLIQIYSQSGNPARNVHFVSNATINQDTVVFWTSDLSGLQIKDNVIYAESADSIVQVQRDSACVPSPIITGNIFDAAGLQLGPMSAANFSSNIVAQRFGSALGTYHTLLSGDPTCDTFPESYSGGIASNTYYKIKSNTLDFETETDFTGGTFINFASWASLVGGEGFSSYVTDKYPAEGNSFPDATQTAVVKAWYSPDSPKAHVTVWNPAGSSVIAWNPSSMLSSGDQYCIRDAQNYDAGCVETAVWVSGSIMLPMTLTAFESPAGNYDAVPQSICGAGGSSTAYSVAHTSSRLGTFIVEKTGVQVASASGVTGTVSLVGGAAIK